MKLINDKLEILYKENETARAKIKTFYGDTDEFEFELDKIVMQGTIFAGLKCTTQLDKLGKKAYHNGKPLFVYKNTVRVPPLEMVDDIAVATTCNVDAVRANSIVNTFIENQKLTLSKKKCHQMHIGKNKVYCPTLNVHESKMIRSEKEKYLGNIIITDGTN